MGRSFFNTLFFLVLCLLIIHARADQDDAVSDTKPNLRAKSLILVKIWCLIIIFFGTFIGGVSPCVFRWNDAFLVVGTQFAGGVFLGTALMHFLSDANETFGDLTSKEYPFAFMLASVGYLLTMLADCAILYLYKRQEQTHNRDSEEGKSANGTTNVITPQDCEASSHHHHIAMASSVGDTILLIVALCFHSVFEGIAIGVSETESDAWKALWTISLHKIFAAIAMSIALLKMAPNRPFLSCAAYAFAFAISSPIGVAIGIVIDATTQGTVADWIFAISMGLACGVFVYVSVNHLLAKGYKPQKSVWVDTPFWKFLAVFMGVGVIAVVMIWDT
ncbi:hypothetical protein V2J09_005781 [Rumex salicifolius]